MATKRCNRDIIREASRRLDPHMRFCREYRAARHAFYSLMIAR
jgi:hypothetical protein